jgi:methionine-rich copper-binding protein CopC
LSFSTKALTPTPELEMKKILVTITGLLSLAGLAQAHTHLEAAMPADNAVLTSAPAEMTLHFSEATRLTALSIQKDGETEQRKVEALPQESAAALRVPLAPLTPGKYTVNWRAIGTDLHVMSGVLHFTVAGK